MTDETSKPHYHSHALSRGMELLRVIATRRTPTTLAELHETTELPKSTLVRLLAVLEDEDYVVRVDERPAYRLGHGLLPITIGYMATRSVADLVRPQLSALAADTGWTANFGILEGTEVLHLCVEFPDRPIHYTATEGSLADAYCSGLGKALLSGLGDTDVTTALPAEPFPSLTPNTITSVEALLGELDLIRRQGFATDAEESAIGLTCYAVPLAEGFAALSVSGPSGEVDDTTPGRFVALLRDTVAELERNPDLVGALDLEASNRHR